MVMRRFLYANRDHRDDHRDGYTRESYFKFISLHICNKTIDKYSQAIDKYDIFLHVRGISSTQKTIIPTTPHTILHTLCSLNVCRQIIHVRI